MLMLLIPHEIIERAGEGQQILDLNLRVGELYYD